MSVAAPARRRRGSLSTRLVASHLLVALTAVVSVATAVLVLTGVAAGQFVEQIERMQEDPGGPPFVPPGLARQELPAGEEFQSQVAQAALVGGAIAALIAVVLAVFVASRLARPVRTSADAAVRLAAGDRHVEVPTAGVDELDDLGRAIERLGHDLDAVEQQRDRLVDDVMHELRTPLAVLRGHVEGLRDGVVAPGAATYERLLAELHRLERLVFDLRSTTELSAASLHRDAVDLATLLRDAAERHRLAADSAGVRLEIESETATASVDRDRIGQVLDNLLSNALAHSPRDTTIVLVCSARGADAVLEVTDSGPGLTRPQQSLVFERFYRTDAARDRSRGGAGIGLAVTKRIVEAHGGRVGVRSQPGAGATFWVTLPRASDRDHFLTGS